MLPSQLAAYLVFRCVGLSFSYQAAAAAAAAAPSLCPSPPPEPHCTVRTHTTVTYNKAVYVSAAEGKPNQKPYSGGKKLNTFSQALYLSTN